MIKRNVEATKYSINVPRHEWIMLVLNEDECIDSLSERLYAKLDKLDGVYDTDYDGMFVFEGILLTIEAEHDTPETWNSIELLINEGFDTIREAISEVDEHYEYNYFEYDIQGFSNGTFQGIVVLDGDTGEEIKCEDSTLNSVNGTMRGIIDKYIKENKI